MKANTLATLVALAVSSAALAGPANTPANTRGLRDAEAKLTARAGNTTNGGKQARLLMQRERVRSLIEDIEDGKSVDPRSIDRALIDAQQP